MAAYKSYRLYITKNSGQTSGYVAIDEWKMFQDEDASGPNVLTDGVASASSIYQVGTPPGNAFDGNPSTHWNSSNVGLPHWLQYDLPQAVEARSIYIQSSTSSERPTRFELLGSNDGVTWESICLFLNAFSDSSQNEYRSSIVRDLSGISLLDDGTAVELIRIFDWDTAKWIHDVVPNADGSWRVALADTKDVLILQYPPAGYRPQADGPVTVRSKW